MTFLAPSHFKKSLEIAQGKKSHWSLVICMVLQKPSKNLGWGDMFCPGRFPLDFAIWVENRILKNIAPTTGNKAKSNGHAKIVEISKDQ